MTHILSNARISDDRKVSLDGERKTLETHLILPSLTKGVSIDIDTTSALSKKSRAGASLGDRWERKHHHPLGMMPLLKPILGTEDGTLQQLQIQQSIMESAQY